jgi:hypothetical protein
MRGACPRSAMSCGLVAAGQDRRGRRFKLSVRAKVLFIWDDRYFHYFLSAMTQKWCMSAPSVCCFGQESNRLFTSLLASSDKPADTSNWLSAPAGNFNPTMRLYGPQTPVLEVLAEKRQLVCRQSDVEPALCWVCYCRDCVAKAFLGWRTKILRAADPFYARRREGPSRLIQNRSRISVVALKSDAAAEKSKNQLSRDF